jgi:uncharacterized iron-regulated protein
MRTLLTLLFVLTAITATAQPDPAAYRLYAANGKLATWKQLLKQASEADVICFGELHDNPICHWLQLELLLALHQQGRPVVLGLEMFETDQQAVLNRWLAGELALDSLSSATTVWPNFATDYKPVLAEQQEHNGQVVATNVPRKYARMVFRQGLQVLDSLPDSAKAFLVPLPFTIDYALPQYQEMRAMAGGMGHGTDTAASQRFVAAQALKDATMAHNILQHLPTGGVLLHLNGTFHTDYREGIVWYLLQARPALRVVTISSVLQPKASPLDSTHRRRADFILAVPGHMTRTY